MRPCPRLRGRCQPILIPSGNLFHGRAIPPLGGDELRLSYTVREMAGPTIAELTIADDAANWSALGFRLADDACVIGSVSLRFADSGAGSGIVGWSLRELASTELDGLATTSVAGEPRAPVSAHPNGVIAIDHVVVMSPLLMRSVEALQGAGLDLRRIREEPTPAGAPRQAFFRVGEAILEVVQEPEEVVARTGGADRPARFWGLALLVEDLDATCAAIAPHAGEPRAAVQPGRRIATVRRSAGLSVPLALMSVGERPEAAARVKSAGARSTPTSSSGCSAPRRCWLPRCTAAPRQACRRSRSRPPRVRCWR